MPANVTAEFQALEQKIAKTKDKREKLKLLEKLLSLAPSHKGAENLRANIRTRIAKLRKELEEAEKKKKQAKKSFGIGKQGIQVCIYALPNSGKSLLLSLLTNAKPKISEWPHTTFMPEIGMLKHKDVDFQLIEFPSLYGLLEDDKQWLSYALTTDLILVLALNESDAIKVLEELKQFNENVFDKPFLIIINEIAREKTERKVINFDGKNFGTLICDIKKHADEIKDAIFNSLTIYRIYLKKPNAKKPEEKPVVFLYRPTVEDVLEEIRMSKEKMIKAIVFGKSVKFDGQNVSIEHALLDGDVVEFYFKKY